MNKNRIPLFVGVGAVLLALLMVALSARSRMRPSPAPTSFVFSAAGDYGFNTNTDRVLNTIHAISPDFHVTTGDMSYGKTGEEEAWCTYVKNHVGSTLPFELISGNHESDGENGLIDTFAKCLPNRIAGLVGDYGKQYYVDYPPERPIARFIFISPTLRFKGGKMYDYKPGAPGFLWLTHAIEEGRGANIPWVVAISHKDCIAPGREECVIGSELMNYLVANVDLILQSHSHIYARSKQLRCVVAGSRGIVWSDSCVEHNNLDNIVKKGRGAIVVSVGTGGQFIRPVDVGDESIKYLGSYMGSNIQATYGVLKVEVSEDTLRGDFVAAVGEFKDTFVIQR